MLGRKQKLGTLLILTGLPTFKVKDLAGNRRAVAVMAVGPAKSSRVREVTANLKLLL